MQFPPPNSPAAFPFGTARGGAASPERPPALQTLVGLAARALQAPAAVLVLTGEDGSQPSFRCAYGLDPAAVDGGALFYQAASREPVGLLVPDALRDPRVAASPLVRDLPCFRACAAVAMRCANDRSCPGVLCVFDVQPRSFAAGDFRTLAEVADLALHELERRHAVLSQETDLEARVRERTAELADAESLQRTREQTAVAELGRYALDERSLQDILDKTAELVARALRVPFCTVTELLQGGAKRWVRAGVGWRAGVVPDAEMDQWHTKLPEAGRPATIEKPLILADLETALGRPSLLPAAKGLGRPRSSISVIIHCDGQRFGTLCALSPEPGRFGEPDALFLQTVADLLSAIIESERHKAASREVQTRYERIAANSPGMVYQAIRHADGTATLPFVSEGCQQLYGLEPAQLRARPELLNEMIHPDDYPRVHALINASTASLTPLQWEGRLVQPSGEVRWITVRSRPERLPNGDLFRDGLILDVTELKRAQEEMRAAKEEAEKANRAKSEFLSRISHELRTPLNAILGFGQLLDLEPLAPRQRSSVDQILKGGRHLLDLINEVLDITRLESGGMELSLEAVDVATVLTEALNLVRPLADQHRVRFVPPAVEGCPAVLADRGRLHQTLLNLLSNAAKYNREDGEMHVTCAGIGEGTVRLSIRDTGLGLTPEELGQLFTPFQRFGAPQRGITGTGLGLTISRSLVEAMGGTIGVESVPGSGSTFHVDLPAAPAATQVPAASAPKNPPPAPLPPAVRTLLLIDDQITNVSLVKRVLETHPNLRLFNALDGRSGLALARKQVPDLILLDLHLPDIGGDEVMRRLRLEARTCDVPVIVLSADATPAQITRLKQLGVREYLTKPFRIRELLAAIDTALDARCAACGAG